MKNLALITLLAIGTNAFAQTALKTADSPTKFIPNGYSVFTKVEGDLNKDNQIDYVFVIKDTKNGNFVKNQFGDIVDRNPRGIIIALKNHKTYELALDNRACFSSENEDGGVYVPPELGVYIEKGILLIHYFHGRYGYRSYKFRYQNSDFELIGYDSSDNHGPIVRKSTSINLLTKKMLVKENVNFDTDEDIEKFKHTWTKFSLKKPIKLSEIPDMDNLDVETYLKAR